MDKETSVCLPEDVEGKAEVREAGEISDIKEQKREECEANASIEAIKRASARLETEIAEFSELFPTVSLEEIPSNIWNEVKSGIPLSASYARHEIRLMRANKEAERANIEAAERSSGIAQGGKSFYFSPSEVKKMSEAEVRSNYSVIIDSMKHWNNN